MKVKELIEKLQLLNPEHIVLLAVDDRDNEDPDQAEYTWHEIFCISEPFEGEPVLIAMGKMVMG